MNLKAPPGVFDILPFDSKEPWKTSNLWAEVEAILRKMALDYGFKELRTPTFEETKLFIKGVGEGTDIVGKEMYTFIDKGERSLTLRPEGTAAVVRAYIENRLDQTPHQKYFYIGSFFRYERMQAGRYREFHQFGIEAYGNPTAEQDVEIIDLAYSICQKLELKGLKVLLNSIGSLESRAEFRRTLIDFLNKSKESLSDESKVRLEKNPLRVLDSKDERDQAALIGAPSILDFLNEDDKIHFEKVKAGLDSLKIPYEITPRLVRGLDYYN
ncbi:MAG: histidine--tRNA ligase, partial [Parachlamydiaceae bacterium]